MFQLFINKLLDYFLDTCMYPTLFSVDYPLHLTSSLTITLIFYSFWGNTKASSIQEVFSRMRLKVLNVTMVIILLFHFFLIFYLNKIFVLYMVLTQFLEHFDFAEVFTSLIIKYVSRCTFTGKFIDLATDTKSTRFLNITVNYIRQNFKEPWNYVSDDTAFYIPHISVIFLQKKDILEGGGVF